MRTIPAQISCNDFMDSEGPLVGASVPCEMASSPVNIHSAATRPVRIRAGFLFIASFSTGILGGLEGLGKGKEEGRGDLPLFWLNERSGRTAFPRAA